LFALAQRFTAFYESCPVLKAEGDLQTYRLAILRSVLAVAEKSLYLLGIKTVEGM
jgi:arginyl-tRNA synthetase